jgi:hypothetical protein
MVEGNGRCRKQVNGPCIFLLCCLLERRTNRDQIIRYGDGRAKGITFCVVISDKPLGFVTVCPTAGRPSKM